MKALITGSFDPPTLGHLDMIRRACDICDSVTVCVFVNSAKKYTFDLQTRKNMILAMCEGLNNVFVDSFDGTVPDYYQKNGFDVIIKGLRGARDIEYEADLLEMYRSQVPCIETMFFLCDSKYRWVSSTAAREILRYGGDLTAILHKNVIEMIKV